MEYRVDSTKEQTTVLKEGQEYDAIKQSLYTYYECYYNNDCGYYNSYELCCSGTSTYDYDTYCSTYCSSGQNSYDYSYYSGDTDAVIGWSVFGSIIGCCILICCCRAICCPQKRTVVVRQPPPQSNNVVVVNNTTTT